MTVTPSIKSKYTIRLPVKLGIKIIKAHHLKQYLFRQLLLREDN